MPPAARAGSRRCQWQKKAGEGPMRHRVQQAAAMLHDNAELRGSKGFCFLYQFTTVKIGFAALKCCKAIFTVNVMDRMKICFSRFSFAGCQKYFFDNLMTACQQSFFYSLFSAENQSLV